MSRATVKSSSGVSQVSSRGLNLSKSPTTPTPVLRATSLLNLDVKVLTQALGAENQWTERGDGRVSFCNFTIRVASTKRAPQQHTNSSSINGVSSDGSKGNSDDGGLKTQTSTSSANTVDDEAYEETVILEDTITSDTPFVGENCCIVWNSFEQQLSLCLMYASEEGYAASWSALVALQDKTYPAFRFDLLERCHEPRERGQQRPRSSYGSGEDAEDVSLSITPHISPNDPYIPARIVSYTYYIHNEYTPPLGFIEQHALSLSVIEHGHALEPALYADKAVVLELLTLANSDLIEHLLSNETFPLLLSSLCSAKVDAPSYQIPDELSKLNAPEELTSLIAKDLRLAALQEHGLPSSVSPALILKLIAVSHRIRNELTCNLLSRDSMLVQAKEALMVAPPPNVGGSNGGSSTSHTRNRTASLDPSSSIASCASDGIRSLVSTGHSPLPPSLVDFAAKAEAQVLAHLRFFRSLVTLSIAELGRDFVGPVVLKVFQCGLLEALSVVAERYGMLSGAAAAFAPGLESYVSSETGNGKSKGHRRHGRVSPPAHGSSSSTTSAVSGSGGSSSATHYSSAIERELVLLLDATVVRLNERQEEQIMNDLIRAPILADPLKYNGFVTFLLRQLVLGGVAASRRSMRDYIGVKNPFLLFHLLGLHDDEGSAAAERVVDQEQTSIRNRFHHLIITRYISPTTRGVIAVPPPPSSLSKSAPIVQFNNANTPLCTLPQGISPGFIRVLEYLIVLASYENRELLLKAIFSHRSHVLQFVESCCEIACTHGRLVGSDVLAGNVRFLRAILTQLDAHPRDSDENNPLAMFAGQASTDPLSLNVITLICRQLTVERDTLYPVLRAYCSLGGIRRDTLYHSAVHSLLEVLERHHHPTKDSENLSSPSQHIGNGLIGGDRRGSGGGGAASNTLKDLRDFLFYKHMNLLPPRFARRFRDALLLEVSHRLGYEDHANSCDSISVLSTTASEMLRSSSKLRFVDEVEAATGGVDGTVVPSTVANLSPAVVASVTSTEDMFNPKKRPGTRQTSNNTSQWPSPSSPNGSSAASGGSSTSAPANGTQRPQIPTDIVSDGAAASEGSGKPNSNGSSSPNGPQLRPTAPKNEKPANRPRTGGIHESANNGVGAPPPAEANGTPSSSSSSSASSSPTGRRLNGGQSERNGGAATADGVVLPKIRKRTSSSSGKSK